MDLTKLTEAMNKLRTAVWWMRYECKSLMDEARQWEKENYDPNSYDKWQDYR